jgi:hypothetical protein
MHTQRLFPISKVNRFISFLNPVAAYGFSGHVAALFATWRVFWRIVARP